MITIQELHAYQNFVDDGVAPAFICPIDKDHDKMIPGYENDEPILLCLGCNCKRFMSYSIETQIKNYIK